MYYRYKIDILDELKKIGYSTYKLRKEHILSESTINSIRNGKLISTYSLILICSILQCQISDILEVF